MGLIDNVTKFSEKLTKIENGHEENCQKGGRQKSIPTNPNRA